jgi:LPXTG-site transpeptidase (sortase) family protein
MFIRVVWLMVTYLAVGTLLAVGANVDTPATAVEEETRAAPPVESTSTETPDEEPIRPSVSTSIVPWDSGRLPEQVSAAAFPVMVQIPSLDVAAEIVESGIDPESRQMEIPPQADQVGWYRFGPRPGEAGSAVLAGHVDMAGFGPGAFFELDRLVPGDEVLVHMSDGTVRRFETVDVVRIPKERLDLERIFDNTGTARLTLITCGGAFNETIRSYDDNVVVQLKPAGGNA